MTKHNADNERIKRKYFAYLKEAKRHSEPTVDAAAKALNRFEVYTKHRDFKTFHVRAGDCVQEAPCRTEGSTVRGEAEQGDLVRHSHATQAILPMACAVNLATSHVFSIPMPTISICPTRTRALLRLGGNKERRHWNRSSTSSVRCRPGRR